MLRNDTVQVWALTLEGDEAERAGCRSVLSAAERDRAERFRFDALRASYELSHGMLRYILGSLCDVEPAAVDFIHGEHGKPALSPECQPRHAPLSFNLSHSHRRALVAVSTGREVGIDIEQIDTRTSALSIADSYFCAPELAAIQSAPEGETHDMFFRYWTAKEAVLKAQGCGLTVPLHSFCVVFDPDFRRAHAETSDRSRFPADWQVVTLPIESGWHAAVAAGLPEWQIQHVEALV